MWIFLSRATYQPRSRKEPHWKITDSIKSSADFRGSVWFSSASRHDLKDQLGAAECPCRRKRLDHQQPIQKLTLVGITSLFLDFFLSFSISISFSLSLLSFYPTCSELLYSSRREPFLSSPSFGNQFPSLSHCKSGPALPNFAGWLHYQPAL